MGDHSGEDQGRLRPARTTMWKRWGKWPA